ncbi:MAG: carotenoid oxygenase [Gammaproteobacteria bacterium]|nr:carotenoid oxygenase [Gammaproteobacteria bacterium]MBT5204278.1 carotenoid oxygenase [Gammaproteobacteria bacterium]
MLNHRNRKENPYLQKNYAPVTDLIEESNLEVIGQIPQDLSGLFVRNGPNPMNNPKPAKHHWFSGQGMLHGVRLDSGNALWYRNRPVSANGNSPNTHVISHSGKIYAIVEAGAAPVEIDPELGSLSDAPFQGTLKRGFTAHSKLDAATGELHGICYDFARGYRLQHIVVGKDDRVRQTQIIDLRSRPMVHDCAITENYVLILDLSITFNWFRLARGYFPMAWNDKHQARIGLLNRKNAAAEIKWFDIDPCYIFHPVNAYENTVGNVVFDAMRYQRLFDKDRNGPFTESPPLLTRWQLDLAKGTAHQQQLDDKAAEFPRIHPGLEGQAHRFGYVLGLGPSALTPDFDSIIKYDFTKDRSEVHQFGADKMGAEPVFVPAEQAESEDQGYLLSYVFDRSSNKSSLEIFNAQDLRSGPVAEIKLPQRIPFGFHGSWVPAA